MGFDGDVPIDAFPVFVEGVDLGDVVQGAPLVDGGEQPHGGAPAGLRPGVVAVDFDLHPPGGVDPGADFEDDVVDGDGVPFESAEFDDGGEPFVGFPVEPDKAVVGQNAVLADDGHDVRGDADGDQVEQGFDGLEGELFVLAECLDEFKADAASGEVFTGVGAVLAFGVEHGDGVGNGVAGQVMVANDEIDSFALGIGHPGTGFDSAVEGDDELRSVVGGVVDPLFRNPVPFGVAVGNVEKEVVHPPREEVVDQRHCGDTVHVVIAVDHDAFPTGYGLLDPLHGEHHIFHQVGVVEFFEFGSEEPSGRFGGVYAALNQEVRQLGVDTERGGEGLHFSRIARGPDDPLFFCVHNVLFFCLLFFIFRFASLFRRFVESSL